MPQFDIASYYPQIASFGSAFLIFYVFLVKEILPKISQNLKLNKKLAEAYNIFAIKGLKDMNLSSHIYKPNQILAHLIYRETISLVFLGKFLQVLTLPYLSSINWLIKTNQTISEVRLFRITRIYLRISNDTGSRSGSTNQTL